MFVYQAGLLFNVPFIIFVNFYPVIDMHWLMSHCLNILCELRQMKKHRHVKVPDYKEAEVSCSRRDGFALLLFPSSRQYSVVLKPDDTPE